MSSLLSHATRPLLCHMSHVLSHVTHVNDHHRRTNNLLSASSMALKGQVSQFLFWCPTLCPLLHYATCPLLACHVLSYASESLHDHTHSQHDGPSSMDQQPSVCIINGIKGIGEATFVLFVLFVSSLTHATCPLLACHVLSCICTLLLLGVSSILTTTSHNKIGHEERKARAHAVFSAMMSKNAMSPKR